MKLILKEYLASLNERGDLDKSVLPNLLSAIGLRVLNTPMIGTRQNGVDIAAVGKIRGEDKQPYLYLFCIKAGNISRRDWQGGVQSVRPELDEIKEVYVRANIAKEYADLPIKICLCCGGELEEAVLMNWAGYTAEYTTDKISYEEWNGDRLATHMLQSLLARELLDEDLRKNFQKAVAMVNEPDACYEYMFSFFKGILLEEPENKKDQLRKLRQAYICLHAVIAWAIEANNLESSYKISELGLLFCWNAVKSMKYKKKPTKHDDALFLLLDQYLKLYLSTSEKYFIKTVYGKCDSLHALSVAVRSQEAVDINLAMFELIGRVAIRGIWTDLFSRQLADDGSGFIQDLQDGTDKALNTIVSIINNNPSLTSPCRDDHMIEIALVMYLAQITNNVKRFLPWLSSISDQTTLALVTNSKYPICSNDYSDLIHHPLSTEQSYRDEVCSGSILYPYLYYCLQCFEKEDSIKIFVERLDEMIPNCTHQAWFPDVETDNLIWCGQTRHGVCVTDMSPIKGYESFTEVLNKAMTTCNAVRDISAIKFGILPMFLTACRHYRLPIPPFFWGVMPNEI